MKLKRARPSDKLLTIDFRQLIEKVRQLIFVTDVKGNVVYLNPYGRKIITRLIGDVTKMKFSNFIAAENLAQGKELLGKIKRGEPIRPYEIDVVDRKGRRIPFLVTQSILKIGKKVVGSVGYAIDITEKRMREHEMSLRMRELSALNAIALVLNQPYDLDRLLNNTLAKILEVTETEAGGICLLDERRQELSLRVHIGLGPEVIKASSAMKIGEGISGKVAQTNRPIIIEDLGAEKRLTRPILLKEGFRSAAVVPIALWGKVIGVFNILTKNPRRYSIDEVNLLINIGNQIGIAIENALLIKQRDEEIMRLNALNRISRLISSEITLDSLLEKVYEQVKTIMHPANFCITIFNERANCFDVILKYEKDEKRRKYSFPPDRGLSSVVFSKKRPILTKDYLTECKNQCVEPYGPPTKAWLGVPIIEKGKAIGCIYVYDFERSDVFDKKDLELLTTIAGQTAVVIENVRQYKILRQRVEELELLFEVGQSVVSITDVETVLDRVVKMLKRKFGHEKVAILLIDEKSNELFIKSAGVPLNERLRKIRIKVGEEGVTGLAAKTGQTLYIRDVRKEKRYIEFSPTCRSEVAVPLKVGEKIIGVLNIEADMIDAFSEDDISLLESISNQIAIAIDNARLYQSLELSYFNTIRALVSAMEAKDTYTRGHSERVREMALKIADEMKLSAEEIRTINYAGFLHDIGKIGISDNLLLKPEPLTDEEFHLIRQHPVIGNGMIKHLDFLTEASAIIRHEHEKFDGTGYPDGLKGEEIPLGARIIAVADAYDAMTTDRPYRKALSKEEAIRRLKEASGTQFDPRVVAVILKILSKDGSGREG